MGNNRKPRRAMETTRFEVIETECVKLMDKSGRLRAVLGPDDGEKMCLMFCDSSRIPKGRAVLQVNTDGEPGLYLTDQNGTPRIMLTVSADGIAGVRIDDEKGKPHVVLGVEPDGTATVERLDRKGQVVPIDFDGFSNELYALAREGRKKEFRSLASGFGLPKKEVDGLWQYATGSHRCG